MRRQGSLGQLTGGRPKHRKIQHLALVMDRREIFVANSGVQREGRDDLPVVLYKSADRVSPEIARRVGRTAGDRVCRDAFEDWSVVGKVEESLERIHGTSVPAQVVIVLLDAVLATDLERMSAPRLRYCVTYFIGVLRKDARSCRRLVRSKLHVVYGEVLDVDVWDAVVDRTLTILHLVVVEARRIAAELVQQGRSKGVDVDECPSQVDGLLRNVALRTRTGRAGGTVIRELGYERAESYLVLL